MCAEEENGKSNLSEGRPVKKIGATNVPKNAHSTILSAGGQSDRAAETNAQIPRGAHGSLARVLSSRPGLGSAQMTHRQVSHLRQVITMHASKLDAGAIGRG